MQHVGSFHTRCIQHLLAEILSGAAGGTKAYWLELIGPVNILPISTNTHCNWSVSPIATGEEMVAITKAIEIVRAEHPYVTG